MIALIFCGFIGLGSPVGRNSTNPKKTPAVNPIEAARKLFFEIFAKIGYIRETIEW